MSIRMIAPTTKATTPPTPKTPKLGVKASVASNPIPTTMSARPAIVDRQQLQGEGAEEQADDAGDGGEPDSRTVELEDEPVDANHDQKQGDVRIGDDAEQFVAPIRLDELHLRVARSNGDVQAAGFHDAPVDELEEFVQIDGDVVDDVHLQRFSRG